MLAEELESRRVASDGRTSEARAAVMARSLEVLEESGIAAHALGVGDIAPDFVLPGASGRDIRLSDLLGVGPVAVSFYRGAWCPYCNIELRALQEALDRFHDVGATLVAISPNLPDGSMTVVERHGLGYPVLSDVGNAVASEYGLVFRIEDDLVAEYRDMGLDIGRSNGGTEWEIPLPATYVVDQDRTIVYAFVDADYRKRAEPTDVIAAIEALGV
ncbi:MAG: peroxiredoxin-like family protein [Acidimicrobiia bacterium]